MTVVCIDEAVTEAGGPYRRGGVGRAGKSFAGFYVLPAL